MINKLDTLSDLEIGWIAGILDGEGYIGLHGGKYYCPLVGVANTNIHIIAKLCSLTGIVHVSKHQPKGNRKLLYNWEVSAVRDVILLLSKVSPHLIGKKYQAEILLEYCLLKVLHNKVDKESYYLRLKELNRRGKK